MLEIKYNTLEVDQGHDDQHEITGIIMIHKVNEQVVREQNFKGIIEFTGAKKEFTLGHNFRFGKGSKLVIGDKCHIGNGVSMLTRKGVTVEMGSGCEIYAGVTISNNTTIGAGSRIFSSAFIGESFGPNMEGVTIGKNVFVDSGTSVPNGTTIPDDALVSGNLPEEKIIYGAVCLQQAFMPRGYDDATATIVASDRGLLFYSVAAVRDDRRKGYTEEEYRKRFKKYGEHTEAVIAFGKVWYKRFEQGAS